jgi:hypothetical protein
MPKRVVLDTGILWELCLRSPTWLETFPAMKEAGWSFHISDVAFAEIIVARSRGSITDEQWWQATRRLNTFLSDWFPCLPGKGDLFRMCGLRDRESSEPGFFDEGLENEISKTNWQTLRNPLALSTPNYEALFFWQGHVYRARLKSGAAAAQIHAERERWVAEMEEPIDETFNRDRASEEIRRDFDTWAVGEPPRMSVRGDLLSRVQAEWKARRRNGLNPRSDNRKNDGIDSLLLYCFLWPALLCTRDRNFHRLITRERSYQSSWACLPEELAEKFNNNSLVEPVWP